MDFTDVVRSRRSIRKYQLKKVSDEKLANIIEAARLAPSGSNRQAWKFIVVRDTDKKNRLAELCGKQLWIADADIVIVCCWLPIAGADETRLRRDVTIATEHIVLAAVNEGLSTCWIGSFDTNAVKSLLAIPQEVGINTMVVLGYPDALPRERTYKKTNEVVCYDHWENSQK
jgi:nitroreductase